jgi:hypothetical protein
VVFDELPPFMTVIQAGEVLQIGRSKVYELTVEWERTGGRSGLAFVWCGGQKRIPSRRFRAVRRPRPEPPTRRLTTGRSRS